MSDKPHKSHTIIETIDLAGHDLVSRIKELIEQGNVRRVIVRDRDGRELLQLPLTGAVAVGGVVALAAPVMAALGTFAALVARVRLEIERVEEEPGAEADDSDEQPPVPSPF